MRARLRRAQLAHVVPRALKAELLRAPPGEHHFVSEAVATRLVDVHRRVEAAGDLEKRRRAAPVVDDAVAFRNRIQVGADDHDLVRVAARCCGQDIARSPDLGNGPREDVSHDAAVGAVESLADCECRSQHRDRGTGVGQGADEESGRAG